MHVASAQSQNNAGVILNSKLNCASSLALARHLSWFDLMMARSYKKILVVELSLRILKGKFKQVSAVCYPALLASGLTYWPEPAFREIRESTSRSIDRAIVSDS